MKLRAIRSQLPLDISSITDNNEMILRFETSQHPYIYTEILTSIGTTLEESTVVTFMQEEIIQFSKGQLAEFFEVPLIYSFKGVNKVFNINKTKQLQLSERILQLTTDPNYNFKFNPTGELSLEWTKIEAFKFYNTVMNHVNYAIEKQQLLEYQVKLINTLEELNLIYLDLVNFQKFYSNLEGGE